MDRIDQTTRKFGLSRGCCAHPRVALPDSRCEGTWRPARRRHAKPGLCTCRLVLIWSISERHSTSWTDLSIYRRPLADAHPSLFLSCRRGVVRAGPERNDREIPATVACAHRMLGNRVPCDGVSTNG